MTLAPAPHTEAGRSAHEVLRHKAGSARRAAKP